MARHASLYVQLTTVFNRKKPLHQDLFWRLTKRGQSAYSADSGSQSANMDRLFGLYVAVIKNRLKLDASLYISLMAVTVFNKMP